MKTNTLLLLAAAAAGVFVVYKLTRKGTGATAQGLNQGGNVDMAAAQAAYSATMPPMPADLAAWWG